MNPFAKGFFIFFYLKAIGSREIEEVLKGVKGADNLIIMGDRNTVVEEKQEDIVG